jgi:transposase
MRGNDEQQGAVFTYVSAEQRIAADHPLRPIRAMTDAALRELSPEFDRLYAAGGRPSIAPEKLLRALLVQVLYGRRSERLLMEEMNYNLLFRWFVGLEMDDAVWDVTVFTKNRERLLAGDVAQKFFEAVVKQAQAVGLLSDEHFTVDRTLLEAWASRRSFVEKKDPPTRGTGAWGQKLLRDTHESTTDPEARLFRRSRVGETQLSGTCDHGEPERTGGGGLWDAVEHESGERSGLADAGRDEASGGQEDHAGGRQRVSGRAIYRGAAGTRGGAAWGRVRALETLAELAASGGAGRSRIRGESEETQTGGAGVRLDQRGGGIAADEVSRTTPGGVDVPIGGECAESPANATLVSTGNGIKKSESGLRRPKKATRWPETSDGASASGHSAAWETIIFSQPVTPWAAFLRRFVAASMILCTFFWQTGRDTAERFSG